MQIREATPDDFPALVRLLDQANTEKGPDFFPPDREKAARYGAHVIENGACYVVEHDGEIVGSIGCVVNSPWLSSAKYLGDVWTYVRPDARNSSAALLLIRAAKKLAKDLGIPALLGILGGREFKDPNELARKVRWYERNVGPAIHISFLWRP
jgi:N-acetylglutamate synthase-like GNAT family acetyltransferase